MAPRSEAVSLYLLLLLAAFAAGCSDTDDQPAEPGASDPATAFVERGAYGVGHRVVDADGLRIEAWYPAQPGDDSAIEYDFVLKFPGFPADPVVALGHAVADAEPAGGRFPLVVFSHGFGLNPAWYHDLVEHLASHGFVVLAPEHSESDWAPDIIRVTVERPADVSATVDFALDGPFAEMIDGDRIAVAGHSYGGHTALAAAGARFDLERLAERCAEAEDPFVLGYFCQPMLDGQEELARYMGLDAIPDGMWPGMGDGRVHAIVAIAGDAYLFGERGLAQVTVPVLAIGGTADTGAPWDWGTGLAFDHVSSAERVAVAFEGSEHFVGVTSCDDLPFMAAFPEEMRQYICQDPTWDKRAQLDLVGHFTTAFLKRSLGGSDLADAALDGALYEAVDGLAVTSGQGAGVTGRVEVVGPTDL